MNEHVMAWASDEATGKPRYIFELSAAENGAACNCRCASCGSPLIAVKAGATKFKRRPHFRHAQGTERKSCMVAAARAAFLSMIESAGYLDLPSTRCPCNWTQWARLHAWSDHPAEQVNIASCSITDEAKAIIIFEDGRQLHVTLVGGPDRAAGGGGAATVQILVDDPAFAALSPEELRSRMRLMLSHGKPSMRNSLGVEVPCPA
ncbi:hypothetical protein P0D88_47480 [Paraburkholderia sp. RL18-103-BIB-C]|uniref:hypothetical protein n=1 Tax=unclassified Paraburkholderia TaxID=2615204 RepID=UPI0038B6F53D